MSIRSINSGWSDYVIWSQLRQRGGVTLGYNSPFLGIESDIKKIILLQRSLEKNRECMNEDEAFQLSWKRNKNNFLMGCQKYGGHIGLLENIHDELIVKVWGTFDAGITGILSRTHRAILWRIVNDQNLIIPKRLENETKEKIANILQQKVGILFYIFWPTKPNQEPQ